MAECRASAGHGARSWRRRLCLYELSQDDAMICPASPARAGSHPPPPEAAYHPPHSHQTEWWQAVGRSCLRPDGASCLLCPCPQATAQPPGSEAFFRPTSADEDAVYPGTAPINLVGGFESCQQGLVQRLPNAHLVPVSQASPAHHA